MTTLDDVMKAMTPDLYERFKRAIEIQRWPNGEKLTPQQLETCMQAVIAYEHMHCPPEERTGYVPPKPKACGDASDADQAIDTIKLPDC